jgi:hypothetical protein
LKTKGRASTIIQLLTIIGITAFLTCGLITQSCSAETLNIGEAINNNLTSSNIFNVYSPKEICYNTSGILLNFSLTAHTIGTIAYSIDNQEIQSIQTNYLTKTGDQSEPFLNKSETNQLTVVGNAIFENLQNGNHKICLYIGHLVHHNLYEVEAYTEINFQIQAPAALLIQKNSSYASDSIPLELTVSEPACLFCSVDNQANYTIVGNTTLNGLSDGLHNVTIFARNDAGSWCTSNTIGFEILEHQETPQSPENISTAQKAEFPFVLFFVVFVLLIGLLTILIRVKEKENDDILNGKAKAT